MGCFDFTYADNGENIRRRNGYVYLTRAFAQKTKLPNPLRFIKTDDYGCFTFIVNGSKAIIDIYALLGCMAYLENQTILTEKSKETKNSIERYLNLLFHKDFDNPSFEVCEKVIRHLGINYHYLASNSTYLDQPISITVPKLGNQREKHLITQYICTAKIPLLISRKKLPMEKEDDLWEIATKWGFVSDNDPEQGCIPTRNHYVKYQPAE